MADQVLVDGRAYGSVEVPDASFEFLQVLDHLPIAQGGHGEGAAADADDAVDLRGFAGDVLRFDDDLPGYLLGLAGALARRRDRLRQIWRRPAGTALLTDDDIHVGGSATGRRVALLEPNQIPFGDSGIDGDEDRSAGAVDVLGGTHGEAHVLAPGFLQDDTKIPCADADSAVHSCIG